MKVTFLGTGTSQGIPVIACPCQVCNSLDYRDNRLRSSVFIEVDDLAIVVDTGPDFRAQMLRERFKKLDAILFTHQHKDHTAGLDDIRPFNHLENKDIPIYGRHEVLEQLKQEFAYIFAENKYPGAPGVKVVEINNEPFFIESTQVTPIEVLHHKLPVFGFRIKDFAYITDANYISETEKKKLLNCEVLVLNALQHKNHLSHFTLKEALEVIAELKPKKAYLTHISHRMGNHRRMSQQLPENVEFAYDGLSFKL